MATYYVGWDVGAWHCDKKATAKSHDAIIVFDENFNFKSCGRGNINESLKCSGNIIDFLCNFTNLEKVDYNEVQFIIAIDAVLGWPYEFFKLLTDTDISQEDLKALLPCEKSINNKFLFRDTERYIANSKTPLSAVKDQIGSQSTKAVFFLKYFGFTYTPEDLIWKNGNNIAIETYPSAVAINTEKFPAKIKEQLSKYVLNYQCKKIKKNLLFESKTLDAENVSAIDVDLQDAIICAWVAKSYAEKKCKEPLESLKGNEGWIWLPEKAEK